MGFVKASRVLLWCNFLKDNIMLVVSASQCLCRLMSHPWPGVEVLMSHSKTTHDPTNRITLDVSHHLESGSGPSRSPRLTSAILVRSWCRKRASRVAQPTSSLRTDCHPHSHSYSAEGHGLICEYAGICGYPEYSRIFGTLLRVCGCKRNFKQNAPRGGWPQRPNRVSSQLGKSCYKQVGNLRPRGQILPTACFCK